ncbi:MAG: type II toxin-antitoxin system RelE/ParE family toxin [Polyangiaceae bacterium]|nr:type II toxin-antitoxin system RelE/ParE family toxin [Polyangiaceae bacterium]
MYDGTESRAARQRLPKSLWGVARRKLDMLHAASQLRDLRIPPSNRLEALSGDLAGKYSIRINDEYRVVFAFGEGNARDVFITD